MSILQSITKHLGWFRDAPEWDPEPYSGEWKKGVSGPALMTSGQPATQPASTPLMEGLIREKTERDADLERTRFGRGITPALLLTHASLDDKWGVVTANILTYHYVPHGAIPDDNPLRASCPNGYTMVTFIDGSWLPFKEDCDTLTRMLKGY